jgi:hypothetical protein
MPWGTTTATTTSPTSGQKNSGSSPFKKTLIACFTPTNFPQNAKPEKSSELEHEAPSTTPNLPASARPFYKSTTPAARKVAAIP